MLQIGNVIFHTIFIGICLKMMQKPFKHFGININGIQI
jgi:hypothetical protein